MSDEAYPSKWEAERCPMCGRAVTLYRPYFDDVAGEVELRDGRVVRALCRRCILDPRWMEEG